MLGRAARWRRRRLTSAKRGAAASVAFFLPLALSNHPDKDTHGHVASGLDDIGRKILYSVAGGFIGFSSAVTAARL